jgi:coenzyme F420-reducing hydrogenase alpha subunit
MGRTIEISPVTRIEGHAKVRIEVGSDGKVSDASLHVMEFRGFERFVQGMQVELMPTITTRICGTCPHAHHLVAAKALDKVFGVEPPRVAVLLRELLNCGSMIHSHAIHFFALAGPDLLLGLTAPPETRNIIHLAKTSPELVNKGLRLRSLGQRIVEVVGGRGTHPVTAVAGGMSSGISADERDQLARLAAEAVELSKFALEIGKTVMLKDRGLLESFPLEHHDMGTVADDALNLYDGTLRVRRADGSLAVEFEAGAYADWMEEQALAHTYSKQVLLRDPAGGLVPYRVGPLARLNCADRIDTPLANAEFESFRTDWGHPCKQTVLAHYARLIEMLHHAEKAVAILKDKEVLDPQVRNTQIKTPRRAVAHIEAPRGVLIHDYDVDSNGLVISANFLVATQHNIPGINATVKQAADKFISATDGELLNGVEFAIRCWDPCLSCSTHQVGAMPLDIELVCGGEHLRRVVR